VINDTPISKHLKTAYFEAFMAVMIQVEIFWVETPEHGPPKRWYPTTTPHGVTTKKTST